MKSMHNRVSLSVEIHEDIYDCIQDFLASNPQWNRETVINASMSLFLLQNHKQIKPTDYRTCSRNYLQSICPKDNQQSLN